MHIVTLAKSVRWVKAALAPFDTTKAACNTQEGVVVTVAALTLNVDLVVVVLVGAAGPVGPKQRVLRGVIPEEGEAAGDDESVSI